MSSPHDSAEYDRFDQLAEEFAGRFRRGEQPSLQEYVDRWPEMEEAIRGLFPALVEVERVERAFEPSGPPMVPTRRPDRLADYRIIGEIGRGGMGVVYEAEQVSLGRTVALKVLPSTIKRDARSLERFRREARSAAQLHHTNIVPVFEVGEDGDSAYYAMQFIRGQGLHLVIEELARLRDRSREHAGAVGVGKDQATGQGSIGPDPSSRPRAEALSPDSMARSLLRGRFLDEGPGASREGMTELTPGASGSMAPDPVAIAPESRRSTSAPSSAVWPGGGPISMSESPGRRRPFFRSVAEIGRQVAGGLAYAHARGVVHRDIKPANLLLDTAGVAWIADFGLAKTGGDSLTEPGDILGTLRFMAPERFRGEGDARADIYALGATLYELLTLRPAFDSPDRLRLIEQVRNVEPRRPRSIDPAIPADLETIVLKAMAKDQSARYPTAAEMAEDLRRFLAGEAIRARRTGPAERLWRWGRRNPLAAGLASAVALMMLVVVAATTISARREHALRIAADADRKEAERSLAELREARTDEATFRRAIAFERENFAKDPTNRDIQGSLDALLSQQASLQRRTGRKAEAVETALARRELNAGEPDRLYQVAMDLADCLPGAGAKSETGDSGEVEASRVAGLAVETLGRAVLAGLRTDEYRLVFTIETNPHFRPLHSHAAFQALLGAVGRNGPRPGGEILAFRGHQGIIESVAITPDGRRALTVGGDRTARLWELGTGNAILPPFSHPMVVNGAEISKDGRLGAVGCNDGLVYLWNLEDGTPAGTLDGGGGWVRDLGLTADGKTLVSGGLDGKLRAWDLEKRVERFRLDGHRGEIIDLAVSLDGRRAVTTGEDETVRIWDIEAGRPVHGPLTGHHGRVWSVALMPDGRRALTGGDDGCLIEWDIVEGRRLRTLWGQWATIRSIAISPDGRRALSGGPRNRLLYWDLEAGRELHRFPGHFGGGMLGVAISPDGRLGLSGGTDHVARVWSLSEDLACARDMVATGRLEAAAVAYRKAVASTPDDIKLVDEKSDVDWRMGRWADLVEDHETFRRLDPDKAPNNLGSARALLMAGDLAGYRRLGLAIRGMIDKTANPGEGNWELPLAGLLAPDSGVDPSDTLLVISREVERHPGEFGMRPVLGLAQYRAGMPEEAIATILPVVREHPDWSSVSTTWPMLAMSYHAIGDDGEAREWLQKTRQLRKLRTPRFGPFPEAWAGPWVHVSDWVDFELLAREAEATLAGADTAER